MVALLPLYEAWVPYLLSFAFVLVHRGVVGTLLPGSVFHEADGIASP
jgi:hypothetical protein